jgi:hypothetical protein
MPTLVVGMFLRFSAILMPTTSVGMAPINYDLVETLHYLLHQEAKIPTAIRPIAQKALRL